MEWNGQEGENCTYIPLIFGFPLSASASVGFMRCRQIHGNGAESGSYFLR